jgi:3-hydroxybutyrate dehydrogenase
VNLLHPIKMSRIAIRRMLGRSSPGIICCISSIAAQQPSIITPLYSVSKAGISHFVRCMARLHEMAEIRVVGVAPGLTGTPLFFDHPEAERHIDKEQDVMISPTTVAEAMLNVCLDRKYPAGTILEVTGQDTQRRVMLLNDPGPQGKAIVAGRKDDALADVAVLIDRERLAGM